VTAEAFYKIIDKAVEDAISGAPASRARGKGVRCLVCASADPILEPTLEWAFPLLST
jgi:hypothetical protein